MRQVSLIVFIPILVISEGNTRTGRKARAQGRSSSWRSKWKRSKDQRAAVALFLRMPEHKKNIATMKPPFLVELKRYGAQLLDDDNLAGAFKAVRDQVAQELGVDDGDRTKIRFLYDQVVSPVSKRGIEIYIRDSWDW